MRRMIRALSLLSAMFLLAACADSHQLMKSNGTSGFSMAPDEPLYVSVPRDGVYGSQRYTGSGMTTAQILQGAFLKYADNVSYGNSTQSRSEAWDAAMQAGAIYLVFPTIVHWEDRATEWSGKPDQIEVKVQVIDVATNTVEASAIAKGQSGLATLGGDRPQDLLSKPVNEFVSSLYDRQ
ncbi:DUF4823 domain-containing protein [Cobetia marina]|uniref:DUF4823 domain-containing protein n=1 Tax=Cobetia marina TaxID=28258 RepID=UPI0010AE7E8B|nr:DUF4823 domain-containing protein [Cobetia marina]TKD64235.1 DUF4823 domain-containing protein [Cobetia marina]